MKNVVLLGTLDTKGAEYAFVANQLTKYDVNVVLVDVGIYENSHLQPTIDRHEVAESVGADCHQLASERDRGVAVTAMAEGATQILKKLHRRGQLDAVFALGGGGGTSIAAHAMRELPIGVPKMILTTIASGDTRPIIESSDIVLMQAVVDPVGLNRVTRPMFANAAAAIAAMASVDEPTDAADRPMIAATMFGVTTPCVDAARARLEEAGFEVLVFHATGIGGATMEKLVRQKMFVGVLDITLTELADELVGGVLSAGPNRLQAAGELGVPQVVSLGALDMVNFGPRQSVPDKFRDRLFYQHNEIVTLMRTTPAECEKLGKIVAEKLNKAETDTTLFVPKLGVSFISTEGQPFFNKESDDALIGSIKANLLSHIEVVELELDINDSEFAHRMADRLIAYCSNHVKSSN